MSRQWPSLSEMLEIDIIVDVVDIGANPLVESGAPPYKPLLDRGLARIVGFEPNLEALETLNAAKGPSETYLPYAVYDGNEQTFRMCQASGMSSLLKPNMPLLEHFHGFDHWGKVIGEERIGTVRLDDVAEISNLDWLKIDIQGGELEVFRHGVQRLAECLVIQTEVEFLQMYEDQPLFSDIDLFLRERGFILHRFLEPASKVIKPLVVDNNVHAGLSQLVWADAVFIRDFTRFDLLSPEQLLKAALILHDAYSSFDVALRALLVRDAKLGRTDSQIYLEKLQS